MRVFSTIMKIVAALAAVVGAVYVAATYGDQIVAWAKKMLSKCPCCCNPEPTIVETPVEEPAAESAPAEEAPAEEAPAEEPVAEESPVDAAPVADENDFEG